MSRKFTSIAFFCLLAILCNSSLLAQEKSILAPGCDAELQLSTRRIKPLTPEDDLLSPALEAPDVEEDIASTQSPFEAEELSDDELIEPAPGIESASSQDPISQTDSNDAPVEWNQQPIRQVKQVFYANDHFKYRNLMFEEPLLERHGITRRPGRQLFRSAAHFFGQGYIYPARLVLGHHRDCESGNCWGSNQGLPLK